MKRSDLICVFACCFLATGFCFVQGQQISDTVRLRKIFLEDIQTADGIVEGYGTGNGESFQDSVGRIYSAHQFVVTRWLKEPQKEGRHDTIYVFTPGGTIGNLSSEVSHSVGVCHNKNTLGLIFLRKTSIRPRKLTITGPYPQFFEIHDGLSFCSEDSTSTYTYHERFYGIDGFVPTIERELTPPPRQKCRWFHRKSTRP